MTQGVTAREQAIYWMSAQDKEKGMGGNVITIKQELFKIFSEFDLNRLDYHKAVDRIHELYLKRLPTANRKSCLVGEHYHQRFKEGWNSCLRRVKEALNQ